MNARTDRTTSRCLGAMMFLILTVSNPLCANPEKHLVSLWNQRFCELAILTGNPIRISALVFSTVGINDCPQEAFDRLDANGLERQFGARKILTISPGHLLLDEMTLYNPESPVQFGELEMQKMGNFEVTSLMIARGRWPTYSEMVLHRKSRMVWPKHKPLFTLISPSKERYVMRSYSQSVDPNLNLTALEGLGAELKLPPKWTYQVEPHSDGLILENNMQFVIIQDQLGNRYQKIEAQSP